MYKKKLKSKNSKKNHPPLTEITGGKVAAAVAGAGEWVAGVGVAVALTGPALREAPEALATLVTGAPADVLNAGALARLLVAEVVPGSNLVAIAR